MSTNSKYTKADFITLLLSQVEHVSADKESADEYLLSIGLNPDEIAAEGLQQIKRKQLLAKIERTKAEMIKAKSLEEKVSDLVQKMLDSPSFKFFDFLKTEQPAFQFRNLESITPAEMKDVLIQHYTLKLLKEQSDTNSDEL